MREPAFQDFYPDDVARCYGCGRLNEKGLHIESRWEGDEAVCRFVPRPEHTAIPGYVYGGLLASLIDCHATGTASAAMYRKEGREMGTEPALRFVTASLQVEYRRPTPLGPELEIRARVEEIGEKKVVMALSLSAEGEETVRGRVVAVKMPEGMTKS